MFNSFEELCIVGPMREKKQIINMNRSTRLPDIGMMVKVFANGPGDLGSIPV